MQAKRKANEDQSAEATDLEHGDAIEVNVTLVI